MTTIPEQARTLAALRVLQHILDDQTDTEKAEFAKTLTDLGIKGSVVATLDGTELGSISLNKGRATATVTDPDKLTAWVEENYPTEVVTVTQIRPAFLTSLLDAAQANGEPVDRNGAPMPGVKVGTGKPYLSTRIADGAEQAVLTAMRNGYQPLALPAGEA